MTNLSKRLDQQLVAPVREARSVAPVLFGLVEASRIEAIKDRGSVPEECGPEIPVAPARGRLTTFTPLRLVPGHVGVAEHTGHWERGEDARRKGGRLVDVFDRMEADAQKHYSLRVARLQAANSQLPKGTKPRAIPAFEPPLSPAQIQIGRDYRNLVERHSSGGVKCVSLEAAGRRQGGSGGEFIDAFVQEGRRLDAFIRRIGTGASMVVRRIRPSVRGSRASIFDRRLVDMICLEDLDPSDVLRAHGWSEFGKTREALRYALAATLDRMIGYRDALPTKGLDA